MPRAIAIDTAGREGSIVSIRDGVIGEEKCFPHGLRHAAGMLLLIDEQCRAMRWNPRDLDELYLSIGPGSFTGLRIAVTMAKMLALANQTRIVAVPTPRVLVENAPREAQNVITVTDAKRGQVFTARYRKANDSWVEQEPPHLDRLNEALSRAPRPVHLIGEGLLVHAAALTNEPDVVITPPDLWRSRARHVARLGSISAAELDYADPLTLTPTYLRLAEAEEKWRADHTLIP